MLLGCCGFHGDVLTVMKNIGAQMKVKALTELHLHVASLEHVCGL